MSDRRTFASVAWSRKGKATRREQFLAEMDAAIPWPGLTSLTEGIFEAVKDLLAEHRLLLRAGTIVDATIIAAPSSTKNTTGMRDPEMKQTRKEADRQAFEEQEVRCHVSRCAPSSQRLSER